MGCMAGSGGEQVDEDNSVDGGVEKGQFVQPVLIGAAAPARLRGSLRFGVKVS